MQSFKLKFLGFTILQRVEFPIFLLIFEWALQQCSATALPVITLPILTTCELGINHLVEYVASVLQSPVWLASESGLQQSYDNMQLRNYYLC